MRFYYFHFHAFAAGRLLFGLPERGGGFFPFVLARARKVALSFDMPGACRGWPGLSRLGIPETTSGFACLAEFYQCYDSVYQIDFILIAGPAPGEHSARIGGRP